MHSCQVGWAAAPLPDDHPLRRDGFTDYVVLSPAAWDPPGTVRACEECGRRWVATRPYANVLVNDWRPEGRVKQWLRKRRGER